MIRAGSFILVEVGVGPNHQCLLCCGWHMRLTFARGNSEGILVRS